MSAICYPVTRPVRTTEPTILQEPISLAEAKKQCGIGDGIDYHDDHLRRLITTAREQVEQDTGLVCYTGSFTWKQTYFASGDWWELPDIRPVTSITSIAYLDGDGTSQTFSAANYALHTSGVNQYIALAYGQTWPTLRGDPDGITVTLVAGYATVLAVPQRVKQAVLLALHVAWLLFTEKDDDQQVEGYRRMVASLQRGSYP